VYFSDLNDDQVEALFARVDWHRIWLQRLHDRVVHRGFPPRDAFRQRIGAALAAHRELALLLNDSRRKGRAHPYLKRARH
jgi:hypothetical protein